MNITKNNISPLRYHGGKTRACKILNKVISEYFDIDEFDIILSPFFGGGSFEFHLQNSYNKQIIANDKLFNSMDKKNWILTYDDCEYIRNLYSGFTILSVDWKYGMNKTKKSSEIIILCV